jgi:hypothetical protein
MLPSAPVGLAGFGDGRNQATPEEHGWEPVTTSDIQKDVALGARRRVGRPAASRTRPPEARKLPPDN